jgi:hypothetical protein
MEEFSYKSRLAHLQRVAMQRNSTLPFGQNWPIVATIVAGGKTQ